MPTSLFLGPLQAQLAVLCMVRWSLSSVPPLCVILGNFGANSPAPSSPNQTHCGRATFRLSFFLFAKHVLLPAYKEKGFKNWENKLVLVIVAEVIK